jgi:hypothetical protein
MSIASQLAELVAALPAGAVREACLTLNEDCTWTALAGGHRAVHIGEWGGDFDGEGVTPEDAIAACKAAIAAKA